MEIVEEKPIKTFFAGLDLGQMSDYSAMSIATQEAHKGKKHYSINYLYRWPLRTPYPTIVSAVVKLFRKAPLAGSILCIDATGVGRAVVDMVRSSSVDAKLIPVTITSGTRASRVNGEYHVPKKDLVGVMQVLLGSRRIHIAQQLPDAKVLARELSTFKMKMNKVTGNETYEAFRERDHDDLVLATAICTWYAERGRPINPLRIIPINGSKRPGLRIVTCTREQLPEIELAVPCVLLRCCDPDETPAAEFDHGMGKLIETMPLQFADLDTQEFGNQWNVPIAPYGKTADLLTLTREKCRELWKFLIGKREQVPEVFVLCGKDEKDRRPLSVALSLCRVLNLPESSTIYKAGDNDWKAKREDKPPNQLVFDTIKSSRELYGAGVLFSPEIANMQWQTMAGW